MAERPSDIRRLSIWISPRDFVQLAGIGLDRPGIRNEIVYGISDNKRAWWNNSNAYRLGYRPEDYSEDFAAGVAAIDPGPTGNPGIDLHQGGVFCVSEFI